MARSLKFLAFRKWNAHFNIYHSLSCFGYDTFASGLCLTAWAWKILKSYFRVASDLLCAFEDFPLIFLESNRRAFWYNQMEDFIQCCIKHRMFHTPPYCNWIEIICNLLLTWILFPTYHLFSHPLSLSLSVFSFFFFKDDTH
jgi:hypothetical protein